MKHLNNSTGFTILELLFFVVIGSALVLIPFRILQGRNQDAQFIDGARTVQAIMQREYNNTLNGVNQGNEYCRYVDPPGNYDFRGPLEGGAPNDGSCIYLGTVMEFGQIDSTSPGDQARKEIRIYPMVARNMTQTSELRKEYRDCIDGLSASISTTSGVLHCLEPHQKLETDNATPVVNVTTIPWGLELYETGAYNSNGLAFYRHPESSRVIPVGYVDGFTDYNDHDAFNTTSSGEVIVDTEYSGWLCFEIPGDDSAKALLGLGFGAKQEVIELATSPDAVSGWCS